MITALTPDALLAPKVIKGAMDGDAVTAYTEKVLVPELAPGTVVILDNLATHKNTDATKALRQAGFWFLLLPSYSPDLNPHRPDGLSGSYAQVVTFAKSEPFP